MNDSFTAAPKTPLEALEVHMQKVSLAVSLLGLGLMAIGLIDLLINGADYFLPGPGALAFSNLIHLRSESIGTFTISLGVVLLGMIPGIRVILALLLYVRLRDLFSIGITLAVLLELLVSVYLGAG
jgi:uncharacterized membrane protein